MLTLSLFVTSEWLADAFISLFGYLCYILTQRGNYFSTSLFVQFLFKTISFYQFQCQKNSSKKHIPFPSPFGNRFFGLTREAKVNQTATIQNIVRIPQNLQQPIPKEQNTQRALKPNY